MNEEWFEHLPLCVFVDTSALRAMHFNISHPSFETIRQAVEIGDIEIVVTDITKGEFIKHSEEVIRADEERIRKAGSVRSFYEGEINTLLENVKALNGQSLWDLFAARFKVVNINSQVPWEGVFADYFSGTTPFSAKKKNEFPDAFNIKMLENRNPSRLVVISFDGDYRTWCSSRGNAVLLAEINEFTDTYLKLRDKVFSARALAALEKVKSNIIEELIGTYSDTDEYEINCGRSEIVWAEVKDLEIVESDLVAVDHDEQQAAFYLRLRGKTVIDLSCPVVAWDSVDKEEMWMGSNSRQAAIEIEIRTSVKVKLDQGAEMDDFEIYFDELYAESFEVPDDWTSFLDRDGDDID